MLGVLNGIALLRSVMFVDWSLALVGVLGPWSVSFLVCSVCILASLALAFHETRLAAAVLQLKLVDPWEVQVSGFWFLVFGSWFLEGL